MRLSFAAIPFVLAVSIVAAKPVFAYCRTTTVEPLDGCDCATDGNATYWNAERIPYTFNEEGFPGLSDASVRAVIARSFAHWTEVTCEGERVELSVTEDVQRTNMASGHVPSGPNFNVIAYLSEEEFIAEDIDEHAFAVTRTYHSRAGEIFGGDIIFNGGLGPFGVCPERGCGAGVVDLENVATHEIGHFFGLGHSQVEGSTMACSATSAEVEKRSLELDDREGICAIYAPRVVAWRADALQSRNGGAAGGCRLDAARRATPAPARAGAWLAVLALSLAGRRARRRTQHGLASDCSDDRLLR